MFSMTTIASSTTNPVATASAIKENSELNALEAQVNISNQNIAAAEAQFRAARAAIRVARSGLFPTVTVVPNTTTSQFPVTRSGSNTNVISGSNTVSTFSSGTNTFYQLPLDLTYEVDLWGRIRRTIESDVANAQASAADIETIRLSTHAELAVDYFQLRELDEEQKLYVSTIGAFQEALQLTLNRYHQGVASQVDVAQAQAQTQLDTARAQATDLG